MVRSKFWPVVAALKVGLPNNQIMLQMLKFIIILYRLEIKVPFVIKSILLLHEENPVYPHVPSIVNSQSYKASV